MTTPPPKFTLQERNTPFPSIDDPRLVAPIPKDVRELTTLNEEYGVYRPSAGKRVKYEPVDLDDRRYFDSFGRDVTGNPVGPIPFIKPKGAIRHEIASDIYCREVKLDPSETIHQVGFDCSPPPLTSEEAERVIEPQILNPPKTQPKFEQFWAAGDKPFDPASLLLLGALAFVVYRMSIPSLNDIIP